ncbi:MAG TPA: hypothetical protein VEV84_08090, partial [Pyrinomonadaceae bacterium]|nr:hypothetical protein [Pyrinomonadaceae bacterium]
MSAHEMLDEGFVELLDDESQNIDQSTDRSLEADRARNLAQAPVNFSLVNDAGVEQQYSIDDLQKLSEYFNREASSRYKAIVLNTWNGAFQSQHFEVGLVQLRNGDHRNGVVHALKVSPLHVRFLQLEDAFFQYLHSHIYDERTQVLVLEHQQKKQSQKTKNWGEGKLSLTTEEALFAQATADADFVNESEEWIDLTDTTEYETNIRRNEAELTTQEFIRLILMEFLRSGSSDMHIEAGQPTGRIRFR